MSFYHKVKKNCLCDEGRSNNTQIKQTRFFPRLNKQGGNPIREIKS